jgi:hypothetical protein
LASNRHGSVEGAIRLLGIGEDNVLDLELNEDAQITPQALGDALGAAPEAATIVLLQAGDLDSGSFDEYGAMIPVAKRHRACVHVDGAFGLWACASGCYRHLLNGVKDADSWATDGHKWLNVPYDSSYAFVERPEAQRAAIPTARLTWFTIRTRGMKWIGIRNGRGGPEGSLLMRPSGRWAGLGSRALVEGTEALEGALMLWRPRINVGLVRFQDGGREPAMRTTTGSRISSLGRSMRAVRLSLQELGGVAAARCG